SYAANTRTPWSVFTANPTRHGGIRRSTRYPISTKNGLRTSSTEEISPASFTSRTPRILNSSIPGLARPPSNLASPSTADPRVRYSYATWSGSLHDEPALVEPEDALAQ